MSKSKLLESGKFLIDDCEFDAVPEKTILEFVLAIDSQRNGMRSEEFHLNHSCEGNASCGTCRVIIETEDVLLPEKNSLEKEFTEARGFNSNERLACQTSCMAGIKIKIPQ